MSYIPIVISPDDKGNDRSYDIYSRLLKDRIIFLTGAITTDSANTVVAQMLFLEAEDNKQDIKLYINSPGGYVSAKFAMYDTMQHLKCDVSTTVIGSAASAAAVLLSAGAKGKRFALPNSKVMIHQPRIDGLGGQVTDIEISAKEMIKSKKKSAEVLAKHTGQPLKKVMADFERDFWLTGKEIADYGIVDKVLD